MKQIIFSLLFFIINNLSGQDMNKGLILPTKDFNECCIYIPKSGLKIYKLPNSQPIGELTLGTPENIEDAYGATIKINDNKEKVNFSNLHMVGYEVFAFKYIDKKNQYLKLESGYWISIKELNSKGLYAKSWMNYLIDKDDIMGWYANDPGLQLRKAPNSQSENIVTLKGDLWEITPTREVDGLWCKVKVKEYREHPCSGNDDLIIRELTGWVKLLTDDQTPNVWNYGKGC